MLDDSYLSAGIGALGKAIDHSWAQGHFGCACIATYLLCAEPELPPQTRRALGVELDKMMASRGHLFGPPEPLPAVSDAAQRIAAALQPSIAKLCHGGHNVIYAALALKAIDRMPRAGFAQVVDGVCRLLEAVGGLPQPVDCFGIDVSGLTGDQDDSVPRYTGPEHLAEAVFEEILSFEPMFYEIQGIVGHLVTHAHSLVEVERLGHPKLARQG